MFKSSLLSAVVLATLITACQNNSLSNKQVSKDSLALDSIKIDSVKKLAVNLYDSTKKYVFLTFDDGPQPGTENVIRVLRQENVPATFFMIGEHVKNYGKPISTLKDSIVAGYPQFLLTTHSYSHAFNDRYHKFYNMPDSALKDFIFTNNGLGAKYKIVRLPGNDAWVVGKRIISSHMTKAVCEKLDSAGYEVIGWDNEWRFKRDPLGGGSVPIQSARAMANSIVYELEHGHLFVKNSVVMLAHDRMFRRQNYADSLAKMIFILKTEHPDYQFRTMENYPNVGLLKRN